MSVVTRKSDFIKATLVLSIGKLTSQFLGFFTLLIYTRYLSASDYGLADLLNTYAAILIIVFGIANDYGLFRFFIPERNNKEQGQVVFSSAFAINIIQCLVYLALFVVLQHFLLVDHKWFLAVIVVVSILYNTMLQFARATGNNKAYALAVVISSFVSVVSGITLIILLQKGIVGFFVSTIVGQATALLFLFVKTEFWKHFSLKCVNRKIQLEIIRYSFPLAISLLLFFLINGLDKIVIVELYGLDSNGVFALAAKISSIISIAFSVVLMSTTESVVLHYSDDDFGEYYSKLFNSLFNLFFTMCIALVAFIPFVFTIFFGADYLAAYPYIPILILGALFQVVSGLLSTIYLARKNSSENLFSTVIALTVKVLLIVLLSSHLKMYGIAISTVGAFLVISIKRYEYIKKTIHIEFKLQKLLSIMLVCVLVITAYYCGNLYLQIVSLLATIGFSIVLNFSLIKAIAFKLLRRVEV